MEDKKYSINVDDSNINAFEFTSGTSVDRFDEHTSEEGVLVSFEYTTKYDHVLPMITDKNGNEIVDRTNIMEFKNSPNVCKSNFTMPNSDVDIKFIRYSVHEIYVTIYKEGNPYQDFRIHVNKVNLPNNKIMKIVKDTNVNIKFSLSDLKDDTLFRKILVCSNSNDNIITKDESDICGGVMDFNFIMPDEDVRIYVWLENNKIDFEGDEINMIPIREEEINTNNLIVDWFTIPDEIAKDLSELLTKQSIREKLLMQVVGDPVKYEEVEKLLIPIVSRVEAYKTIITKKYVPAKYNSEGYLWNYDGYEIDKNKVQIIKA